MNKKMKVAGIVNVASGVFTLLALLFILFDIAVLKSFQHRLQGWDGVGVALLFALSAAIEYPATVLQLVYQGINGGIELAYQKRGRQVHKALRVIAWIVGVVAAGVHLFFAVTYFGTGFVLWGLLIALAAVGAVASPLLTSVAHKEN